MTLEFNVWLAGQMYRQGLSTAGLAADLGLPDWRVYSWLSGDDLPVDRALRRLCELLEVRPLLVRSLFYG